MPNPSNTTRRAKAQNIVKTHKTILTPKPSSKQDRRARSPQPEVRQLNLLALLENPQKEPALRIEVVPAELIVNSNRSFWIIHQKSELRVPGQFSRQEAEQIVEETKGWNWAVDPITHEPAYKWRLLSLLEYICSNQAKLEVAA
jgi:hypothetical protein